MAAKSTSFAERLRKLRGQAGLTKYALAKRTGLSKQGIAQLESGRSEPSWITVQLLATVLGVDYEDFADPALTLPDQKPSKPRGRPRKMSVESNGEKATTAKKAAKKQM